MKLGLVFLPSPGISHLVSTVELTKRLLKHDHHHSFSITVLSMRLPMSTSTTDSYIESIATSAPDIRIIELPPVAQSAENQNHAAFLSLFIESHKAHVKDTVSKLLSDSPSLRIAALIIDIFSTSMIDVANELHVPAYVYHTSGAAVLGILLHLPTLHETIESNFGELDGEIEIPGMSPVPPLALPSNWLNKNNEGYTWFLYHGRRFREAKGIIVNTFAELEPAALEALREGKYLLDHPTPPVYPVGPLLGFHDQEDHTCIKWLDEQPLESVVFLCFGSMGIIPTPQLKEMALGLERSGHRFLWSLRFPSKDGLHLPVEANLGEILPKGFLDRTKGRGLVWPTWAPQVAILAHKAIGGFVSHCGWNSILESLWFGVPILAWPLYAEQKLNAFQMVGDLGLAVDLKIDYKSGGFVSLEEFEMGLRSLMGGCDEGKKVRERVKEMGRLSRKAEEEGGGSSFGFLKQLVDELAVAHE